MKTTRGSARVDTSTGKTTRLDARAGADEVVTEEDVKDTSKLARLLCRVLKSLADLQRRYVPRRIDFHDIVTPGGGGAVSLQHNFGGRTVWWVIDATGAVVAPILQRSATLTDANTLVLLSYTAGTVSIRVEDY